VKKTMLRELLSLDANSSSRMPVAPIDDKINPSAAKPQLKPEYLAQRRKGRKEKMIPNLAFLASWREN
jgi:hypothetical protein